MGSMKAKVAAALCFIQIGAALSPFSRPIRPSVFGDGVSGEDVAPFHAIFKAFALQTSKGASTRSVEPLSTGRTFSPPRSTPEAARRIL
jgi:hypothetical protein